jgi:hypothetical protein
MDDLLPRSLEAHEGLGNFCAPSCLTAEMALAFAKVSGPDDLSAGCRRHSPNTEAAR